jgi:hypothetical protein
MKAYYNFHVVYFSTDLQVIDPAIGDRLDVFGGVRLQLPF